MMRNVSLNNISFKAINFVTKDRNKPLLQINTTDNYPGLAKLNGENLAAKESILKITEAASSPEDVSEIRRNIFASLTSKFSESAQHSVGCKKSREQHDSLRKNILKNGLDIEIDGKRLK